MNIDEFNNFFNNVQNKWTESATKKATKDLSQAQRKELKRIFDEGTIKDPEAAKEIIHTMTHGRTPPRDTGTWATIKRIVANLLGRERSEPLRKEIARHDFSPKETPPTKRVTFDPKGPYEIAIKNKPEAKPTEKETGAEPAKEEILEKKADVEIPNKDSGEKTGEKEPVAQKSKEKVADLEETQEPSKEIIPEKKTEGEIPHEPEEKADSNTLNGKIISTVNAPEIKQLADQEDPEALFERGKCYQDGDGVKQDLKMAFKYYQLAADQGNAKAQVALGNCYRDGVGVKQDAERAVKYYELAADQENVEALVELGNYYHYRSYSWAARNLEKAAKYYQFAANEGNPRGLRALSNCYNYGLGVEGDAKLALRYLRLAELAETQGEKAAKRKLRMMHAFQVQLEQEQADKIADLVKSERKELIDLITTPGLTEDHKKTISTFLISGFSSLEHDQYSPVVMDIASNFGEPLPNSVKDFLKELIHYDLIWGFGFNKTQVFCYWSPKSEEILNASGLIGTGAIYYKDGDQVIQKETVNGKIISI